MSHIRPPARRAAARAWDAGTEVRLFLVNEGLIYDFHIQANLFDREVV